MNLTNSTTLDYDTTGKLTLARGYTALATLFVSFVLFSCAMFNMARSYVQYEKQCSCFCSFLIDYFTNPFCLFAFISLLPEAAYWDVLIEYPIHRNGSHLHREFCERSGYALVWFESAETWALAVFSLVFLIYYILRHQKETDKSLKTLREYEALVPKPKSKYYRHRLTYVLTAAAIVLLCAAYTNPYFVGRASDPDNGYGVVGPWCWIVTKPAQNYFWFYEEWVLMFVGLLGVFSALVLFCIVVRDPKGNNRPCKTIWWDKTIMVPFSIFLFYFVLQLMLLVVEICVRLKNMDNTGLWYTYAIGKPLSKVLLVLASLQMMSTSYRLGIKKQTVTEGDDESIAT